MFCVTGCRSCYDVEQAMSSSLSYVRVARKARAVRGSRWAVNKRRRLDSGTTLNGQEGRGRLIREEEKESGGRQKARREVGDVGFEAAEGAAGVVEVGGQKGMSRADVCGVRRGAAAAVVEACRRRGGSGMLVSGPVALHRPLIGRRRGSEAVSCGRIRPTPFHIPSLATTHMPLCAALGGQGECGSI